MNRKQIINVLLSLSMVFMAVMPMNGVIALAAEAAEGATAGITASADPEEIGKAPETVAEEIMSDDTAGPEESQAADTSDDMRTDSAETAMTVEEEDAAEEVQRDAMEYGSDDTSGSNDYDFPVIVIKYAGAEFSPFPACSHVQGIVENQDIHMVFFRPVFNVKDDISGGFKLSVQRCYGTVMLFFADFLIYFKEF